MAVALAARMRRLLVLLALVVACNVGTEIQSRQDPLTATVDGGGSGCSDTACAYDLDAREDAGCVGQPEPNCPFTPPGYLPEKPPILSGGTCRGACGPACPAQCGIRPAATVCLEWQTADCQWHSKVCSYPVQSCGSHQGCRDHDSCYDGCAWALWPAACRRGCDIACLDKWGKTKCESWMMGGGPYDKQIEYTGKPTSTTYDTTCY